MTSTFAAPADAAEAIVRHVLQLRRDAWQKALTDSEFRGTATFAGVNHTLSAVQEDVYLRCLGHVLGTDDEDAVDAYVTDWAERSGADLEGAGVRIRQMPTPGDLYDQRAEAQVLDTLREAGAAGLSKTRILPLLATDRLAFGRGDDSRWLKQWIAEGTVVERHRGRGTVYLHREAVEAVEAVQAADAGGAADSPQV
ncbi:hypothetical protein [Streptomyces sp. CBMA156]|uniref:hypothetical protein n=1 Tax=Streptomyces sp. CBMA156 TaxID=1930280 RepID=UPI001661AFC1|nr:hypothetical protein [Streptomyces sp. CBMA156]MBD0669436.1 hypothetical protein [Streptomyces sp. CBMA156]